MAEACEFAVDAAVAPGRGWRSTMISRSFGAAGAASETGQSGDEVVEKYET